MQEVFSKIIEKLEELKKAEIERDDLCDEEGFGDAEEIYEDGKSQGRFEQVVRIIEIVKKEAEKLGTDTNVGSNGWIPCIEKLPDDFMGFEYLTIRKGHTLATITYYCVVNHKWYLSRNSSKEIDVIAWQPLPEVPALYLTKEE